MTTEYLSYNGNHYGLCHCCHTRMKFTTSWDDGHPLDLRIAEILARHGMTGTCYIAKKHPFVPTPLADDELKQLSQIMEIGAHTLNHPILTQVTSDQAREEIRGSKTWLENILQKPCTLFCYPRGEWNDAIKAIVKESGFAGARSTQNFAFHTTDPFLMPSTIHIYHFPLRPIANRRFIDPARRAWTELDRMHIPLWSRLSWLAMSKAVFDYAVRTNQPYVHLRGHSWELERLNMWKEFEAFIEYVSKQPNIEYVQNSALLSI